MKCVLSIVVLALLIAAPSFAQEKSTVAPGSAAAKAEDKAKPEPQLAKDARDVIASILAGQKGYETSINVLTEKRDALMVALNRYLQQLQVEGYDLDLSSPTGYVAKKKPAQ